LWPPWYETEWNFHIIAKKFTIRFIVTPLTWQRGQI
jgi:hypothetical protein